MAVYIVPGIQFIDHNLWTPFITSLLLGILNAVIRPLLMLLALPLLIFTLGFFTLIINAALLYFVGYVLRSHFYVKDFWSAFWGALIISVIAGILGMLTGTGKARVRIERGRRPPNSDRDGGGPVIDI